MLSTNCKHRRPIKELLAKCKDLKHKIDEYDRKYAPLKKDIEGEKNKPVYVAIKGDEIDEIFAKFLN